MLKAVFYKIKILADNFKKNIQIEIYSLMEKNI